MLVCFFSVPSFCVVTSEAVSHSHARAFQSGHDQESSCADTPVYALLAVHSSPSVSLRASSTPFSIVYEVEWCGVEWSALVSSGVARSDIGDIGQDTESRRARDTIMAACFFASFFVRFA